MITIDTIARADGPAIPDRFREELATERELDGLVGYGSEATLERIRRLASYPSPTVAARARFAEALVGHRSGASFGVQLHDVVPDSIPDRFRIPLEVRPANPDDRRALWDGLADGSYGVAPALSHAVRLDSDEEAWLVVPDGRFCYRESLERLHGTRSLLGLVGEQSGPGFSPALLILTSPGDDGDSAVVHVHDTDGELVYAGSLCVADGVARFSFGMLRSRSVASGATALEIEGHLSEDGFRVTGAWTAPVAEHTNARPMVRAASRRA